MIFTYLTANCVYIVLIATSFQTVLNYNLDVDWDVRYYIAAIVLPCQVLGQIRKLKYLVPFSMIANVCIVITFAITLWYILTGPMPIAQRPLFSSWAQIPLFFRYIYNLREFLSFISAFKYP